MTQTQISLVQTTFRDVAALGDAAIALFYDRLFALDPSLRSLFPTDMAEQRAKLLATLGLAIKSLDDLPALLPALDALGERHVGYGVQPAHYETVGAALLETLSLGLGEGFTPEVREAWATAYGLLAGAMQRVPMLA